MSTKDLASHWLRVAECYRQRARGLLSVGPLPSAAYRIAKGFLVEAHLSKLAALRKM